MDAAPGRSLTAARLFPSAAWGVAFTAAWLGFAWTAAGGFCFVTLLLAVWTYTLKRPSARRHGTRPAAYALRGLVLLSVLAWFAYTPDWLVVTILGACWLATVRDTLESRKGSVRFEPTSP